MSSITYGLDIIESISYNEVIKEYKEKYGDEPTKATLSVTSVPTEDDEELLYYTLAVQRIKND